MVICTDYRSKDKFSNRIFLEYLYDNIIPKNDEVEEEIIWSDSPTSEFKNKYICHFMDKFSTKYNKRFLWTFSATSHSKGVVDGIGGNVKSIVQSQLREKERTRSLCRMQSLSIKLPAKEWMLLRFFLIDETQVEGYTDTDLFNGCQTVTGIMPMHLISARDDGVRLWKNVSFYQKIEPSIIVNKQHINTIKKSAVSNNIIVGDCVKIISGLFQGYCAVVFGWNYGDENEIQYFTEKTISGGKYWVLKENYLNSRENCELKKVVGAIYNRDHYTLMTIKLYRKFALIVIPLKTRKAFHLTNKIC